MTLFQQIALLLSIFLLVVLTTVMTLNFQNANQSVQERLYEDAKNTASSLSLSLGSANGDEAMMATMINANFDSGAYSYISLIDIDDNLVYERISETQITDVPEWFLNLVNIEAPFASAQVSAGWNPIGILNVQSDATYAYIQLYNILKQLLISFSIIAITGLVILNLLLIAILKPLKRVQLQAEAVIKNEFITQEKIPYTKEFRDVVIAMNSMVSKVKAMFDKGNEELKKQKELDYIDQITKLKNRKYLIHKLPEYLKIDASSKGGINMMISFSGVTQANIKIGHQNVDKLLREMAQIFEAHASNYKNSIVARMNGTEFTILLPDCSDTEGLALAQGIQDSVKNIFEYYKLDLAETYISIGLYQYNYMQRVGQLLALTDYALAQAKFNVTNIHLDKADEVSEVMGKEAWREIINKALKLNRFMFTAWKAVDVKRKKVAHNVLSISMKADDNVVYSYGQFMASANQAGLSSPIYKNIISMMFKAPDKKFFGSVCSLRLSFEYLDHRDTYDELSLLFKEYALKLPFTLILEIPDKMMRENSKYMRQYKALFEKYNIEMGVFEFIGESSDYQYLQDLRPVYIQGESSYFLSLSEQSLSALRLITDTVGITLVASSVMDMQTLSKLKERDIFIVQGKATEMIELV